MTTAALSLSTETLAATFPWHFVFDETMRVRSAGPVLRRLVPEIDRLSLDALFVSLLPREALTVESVHARTDHAWLLQSKQHPLLVLRGQIVATVDRRFMFVGSPRATLNVVHELGLTLQDFAAHDAIGDWLFLAHAQQASLADATRFSNELAALNGRLEALVDERTRELQTANAELKREKAERERIEDELRLAHRLEAVGQLASGVAHEINTPIQYVGNSVQFLDEACRDLLNLLPLYDRAAARLRALGDPDLADALGSAREAADAEFLVEQLPHAFTRTFEGLNQVAEIVRAMKAFAHPGHEAKVPADINEAIRNTLTVTRNEYKYVADVETDLAELPPVPCNVSELNQVFLNLIVNSAHAIGEKNDGTDRRGRLVVRTSRTDSTVVIEVSDDGAGIPDAIRDRIFDPFFTTKPVGTGTGQGLTIARSIILRHAGKLEVRSVRDEGTTFKITLPLEAQSDEAAA